MGHMAPLPRAGDRPRRASRVRSCWLRRHLDRHVVRARRYGWLGRSEEWPSPLDGRRAHRYPPRAHRCRRRHRPAACGRLLRVRRGGVARPRRHGPPAGADLRGRAAGSDPARDPLADPGAGHLRSRLVARRARPAALALLSALPARRLRRVRPALGASRGGSLRPGGDAVRGDGRRGAPDQLSPRRPRPRDGELAA